MADDVTLFCKKCDAPIYRDEHGFWSDYDPAPRFCPFGDDPSPRHLPLLHVPDLTDRDEVEQWLTS